MNTATTAAVRYLPMTDVRTYALAAAFVGCNVLFPQLCHLVPGGGLVWLPIYFFTLVAAYKYGMGAGLLTAVLSPVANNLLFGMPPTAMLPIILVKSAMLAVAAAMVARRLGRVTLPGVACAVVAYQTVGLVAEWGMTGSLTAALQDVRMGWPGLLTQVMGGWAVMRLMAAKGI